MRVLGFVAMLVALWLLAWGELSLANVISGIVVAAALLVVFPMRRRHAGPLHLDPLHVVRLVWYVVTQLVTSNIVMTRQILRRRNDTEPGVLAHRLRRPSHEVVTLMSSIIALSPGMMTVDVDTEASTIFVHFFDLQDVAEARRVLARLERLIVDAIARPPTGGDPAPTIKETS